MHAAMRFKMSLIFLMAGLIFVIFLLLFAMIGVESDQAGSRSTAAATSVPANKAAYSINRLLDDPDLGFTLKMPAGLGQWLYRTGSVKSPVDETLSDKFVAIYVPRETNARKNNFDDLTIAVLTVREFSKKEWNALDKGCQRGNEDYCRAAGTEIDETNNVVYTYTKPEACPEDVRVRCALADEIIKSFAAR